MYTISGRFAAHLNCVVSDYLANICNFFDTNLITSTIQGSTARNILAMDDEMMEWDAVGAEERPFLPFEASSIARLKYKKIADFYHKRTNNKKMRDLLCLGCKGVKLSMKWEQAVNHALRCKENSEDKKRELQQEIIAEGDSHNLLKKCSQLVKADKLTMSLVELVALESLPLSFIRSQEAREIFSTLLGFKFVPSGPNRIRNRILPEAAKQYTDTNMIELRKQRDYTVTIEFDAWTSRSRASLLGTVVTSPNGASMLLDLTDISGESHTADYLCKTALQIIYKNEFPLRKLNAIVSDEASAFKLARELIAAKLKTDHKRPLIIEYRCFAHVFNLMISAFAQSRRVSPSLEKLSTFINAISRNKVLVSKIEELGGKRLVHSTPTRWFSISSSIRSAIAVRPFLAGLEFDPKYGGIKWAEIYNDTIFWEELSYFFPYVKRLSSMIGVAEKSCCTVGRAFHEAVMYGKFLWRELVVGAPMKFEATSSYLRHMSKLNIRMMLTAYVLDPNSRCRYLTKMSLDLVKEQILVFLYDHGHIPEVNNFFHREFLSYLKLLHVEESDPFEDVDKWWSEQNFLSLRGSARRLCAL